MAPEKTLTLTNTVNKVAHEKSSMTITNTKKEKLVQIGCFPGGHNDHILSIGTLMAYPDRLMTTSRDKSMLVWKLVRDPGDSFGTIAGRPMKRYTGHSHFVTEVAASTDSKYAITSSWDNHLRLWDLEKGKTTNLFKGHTSDILSVGLSDDNRSIISGGRDKTVKLWNVVGQCMYTIGTNHGGHTDWVSKVVLAPRNGQIQNVCFSASWDSTVKMTSVKTWKVDKTLEAGGNGSPVISMELSPDASLCAMGTKDHRLLAWDLEKFVPLWTLSLPGEIRAIAFSPHSYHICVAVKSSIFVYDLVNKGMVDEATVEASTTASASTGNKSKPEVLCLRWSTDGTILFAGYSDGILRAWKLVTVKTVQMTKE